SYSPIRRCIHLSVKNKAFQTSRPHNVRTSGFNRAKSLSFLTITASVIGLGALVYSPFHYWLKLLDECEDSDEAKKESKMVPETVNDAILLESRGSRPTFLISTDDAFRDNRDPFTLNVHTNNKSETDSDNST
ncbi:hypothetical protein PMAYCL1PPCAC_32023, partial [Pristionchus mayeri]